MITTVEKGRVLVGPKKVATMGLITLKSRMDSVAYMKNELRSSTEKALLMVLLLSVTPAFPMLAVIDWGSMTARVISPVVSIW